MDYVIARNSATESFISSDAFYCHDTVTTFVISSAKVKKFLRLLKKFGTSKVTKPAQLAQSCSEYDFVNKSTPTLLRVSIE